MKIREIIGALEQFAPLSLQDSYDNAGLQIGLTENADVSGALLCLDVTEEVGKVLVDVFGHCFQGGMAVGYNGKNHNSLQFTVDSLQLAVES